MGLVPGDERIGCPRRGAAIQTYSRRMTSAGCTARSSTADGAELIGRAFARVLAELAVKPVAELRVGLGRDMRLSAPELAAATARACSPRACT